MDYRQLPPRVFDVRIHRNEYRDTFMLQWYSEVYQLNRYISFRYHWDGDLRAMIEFVKRLVGGTIAAFITSETPDSIIRVMLEQMAPHFERAIFHEMERQERYLRAGREFRPYWAGDHRFFNEFNLHGQPPRFTDKAVQKAEQLLLRHLDDGQKKQYRKDKSFRVTGKDGQVYTITSERSFNVHGPDGVRYCGQTPDTPIPDQMLAQMQLLKHDPDKFFKNANKSDGGAGFQPGQVHWIQDDYPPFTSPPRQQVTADEIRALRNQLLGVPNTHAQRMIEEGIERLMRREGLI